MSNQKNDPPVRVYSHLSSKEEAAYRSAVRDGDFPLSPTRQAQLFELYLNGMSCEEIAKYAKGVRLGQVVRACVEGDWHTKYTDYVARLLGTVQGNVQQVQSEAIHFAATCLRVAHKQHGQAMLKYLETGEPGDLKDFAAKNLGQYRQLVDLLMKLTGQDRVKSDKIPGDPPAKPVAGRQGPAEPEVMGEGDKPIVAPGPMELLMKGPPDPATAAALIKSLYDGQSKA